MSFELHVSLKSDYLHITVTGTNSKATVAAYLENVVQECRERHCDKVLIEENLVGPRLGMTDIYEIVSEHGRKAAGVLRAIAYVDLNAKDDSMLFAETVAVNRDVPVRVFNSVDDAEDWISGQTKAETVH